MTSHVNELVRQRTALEAEADTGFLIDYMETGILPANPFATLDPVGGGPRGDQ